jgi:prolyl-tRNA editing enzyme YbaK/EbsC (Cys-tRNA(Pro) deacylase)
MWPDDVERIAAFLRASGAQGQLEQLPTDVDEPPGPAIRAVGFDCDGRTLAALVPGDRAVDRDKLRAAAACSTLVPAPAPGFPFQPSRVFVERTVLALPLVWLEAGSPRHVLGLSPSQLVSLTRAVTADLVLEAPT